MEIVISNLSKKFGSTTALDNVTLKIGSGMFGLLGRNGAGKTTFMRILTTILPKSSGTVTICGVPVENTREIRKMIGYLPQDFSLYPNMTVHEAMDYLSILSEVPRAMRNQVIPILLDKVNLSQHQHVRIKALSGGMKRRLGIAQALVHDPKVLIVDEPTAGLDPEERIRLRNLLNETAEERIVIPSTHIVGDIEATCENVAVLDAGKVIFEGKTTDLALGAQGKVYKVTTTQKDLPGLREKHIVIAATPEDGQLTARIIANNKPNGGAVPCPPTVEDGYMLLMGGRAQ
ncbi:MAG: ATP-binding cassette domain-containing protein [Firmicutes bacterium]|nr:ATP-binding cassette domain-containing protein [Bacillota bacterium]